MYAYRQGQELPAGCEGYYVEETLHNYSGDIHADDSVLLASQDRVDMTGKKVLDGEIVDMTEAELAIIAAQALAEWQASEEYAKRYTAQQIVTAIQGTLTTIGVAANEKAQVFADVDAWVQAAETDGAKVQRLETAVRLQVYYGQLIELMGDATGLINGVKTIDLEQE